MRAQIGPISAPRACPSTPAVAQEAALTRSVRPPTFGGSSVSWCAGDRWRHRPPHSLCAAAAAVL